MDMNSSRSLSDESSMESFSSPSPASISPQIIIRRPIDIPVTPIRDSLIQVSSPYPRDAIASPFQVAMPVIITPVETRSSRDIVRLNRLRRIRNRQQNRYVLNSIRRRLSMVTLGENRTELRINTPGSLPRSRRIDKTATAIEMDTSDAFEAIISEEINYVQLDSDPQFPNIPSNSFKCAKMREINRLETLDMAIMTLTSSCEEEILEAIGLLGWNMDQMNSELDAINQILLDIENEKQRKSRKWAQIELILSIIQNEN